MDKRDLDFAEQASIDVFDDAGFWVGKKVSWEKLISLIRADEREACAKVCDAHKAKENLFAEERYAAHWLAEAIRARGDNV